MNRDKEYTLAKIYTVYIAVASVFFAVSLLFDGATSSVWFEIVTESGFLSITSMVIIAMQTALYATGGNNMGSVVLGTLYLLIVAGSFGSVAMVYIKKKYVFFLISLFILAVDAVLHIFVGGIMFPAVIGLIFKGFGIYILFKAYKIHKNEQKENKDDIT
ncbi:MAG: hypothetical protein IKM61_03455 [Eubacteriaceae bacterium]|nr:hypothetical protein [Eubacteriaceae bacterium]